MERCHNDENPGGNFDSFEKTSDFDFTSGVSSHQDSLNHLGESTRPSLFQEGGRASWLTYSSLAQLDRSRQDGELDRVSFEFHPLTCGSRSSTTTSSQTTISTRIGNAE